MTNPSRVKGRLPLALGTLCLVASACGGGAEGETQQQASVVTVPPDQNGVTILKPLHNSKVSSPFTVEVEPTGDVVVVPLGKERKGEPSGHVHLVIDHDCIPVAQPIPVDEDWVVDLKDGSTSTQLDLPPGVHEICAQIGDAEHIALYAVSRIVVTVE
ncbi:MAG: hypothetical protein KatS3mg008_1840 [Acidimicrobiales bacterium]|nr:MAG: hypothetical protein KatS3mg008_1840 [Acidimicrobiales bacterium]